MAPPGRAPPGDVVGARARDDAPGPPARTRRARGGRRVVPGAGPAPRRPVPRVAQARVDRLARPGAGGRGVRRHRVAGRRHDHRRRVARAPGLGRPRLRRHPLPRGPDRRRGLRARRARRDPHAARPPHLFLRRRRAHRPRRLAHPRRRRVPRRRRLPLRRGSARGRRDDRGDGRIPGRRGRGARGPPGRAGLRRGARRRRPARPGGARRGRDRRRPRRPRALGGRAAGARTTAEVVATGRRTSAPRHRQGQPQPVAAVRRRGTALSPRPSDGGDRGRATAPPARRRRSHSRRRGRAGRGSVARS